MHHLPIVAIQNKDCIAVLYMLSDSAGILTQDLQNRNLTLYTAKLRSPFNSLNYQNGRSSVADGASKGAASNGSAWGTIGVTGVVSTIGAASGAVVGAA